MVIKIKHAVEDKVFDNEILVDTLKVLIKLYNEKYIIRNDMTESEKNEIIKNKNGALKRINELVKEAKMKNFAIPKDILKEIRNIKFKQINKEE